MCICNRHISSAMTLLIMHCFWFRSCLFHGSSDTYHCTFIFYRRMYIFQSLWLQACIGDRLCLTAPFRRFRACKKTRPTTSAVVTTSRPAVYHPPFCYCAIWQRETDFNCSRYLCFSRIERLVVSCWSAGDPYWPKRSERMHTRTCASLAWWSR